MSKIIQCFLKAYRNVKKYLPPTLVIVYKPITNVYFPVTEITVSNYILCIL